MKDPHRRRDSDPAFHLALEIAADAAEGRYTYPDHVHPETSVVEMWGHELARAVMTGDAPFLKRLAKWSEYLKREGKVADLGALGDYSEYLGTPDERTIEERGRDAYRYLCRVMGKNPPTKNEWKEATFRSYARRWRGEVRDGVEDHRKQLDRAARNLGLKFAAERLSRTSSKRSMS